MVFPGRKVGISIISPFLTSSLGFLHLLRMLCCLLATVSVNLTWFSALSLCSIIISMNTAYILSNCYIFSRILAFCLPLALAILNTAHWNLRKTWKIFKISFDHSLFIYIMHHINYDSGTGPLLYEQWSIKTGFEIRLSIKLTWFSL